MQLDQLTTAVSVRIGLVFDIKCVMIYEFKMTFVFNTRRNALEFDACSIFGHTHLLWIHHCSSRDNNNIMDLYQMSSGSCITQCRIAYLCCNIMHSTNPLNISCCCVTNMCVMLLYAVIHSEVKFTLLSVWPTATGARKKVIKGSRCC